MISLLIFHLDDQQFAINVDQIYRIERFDATAVEFNQESPAFYRVGDYVISLDWLTPRRIRTEDLNRFSRLILYRAKSKIRGIPVIDLNKVITDPDLNEISLVPAFFRDRPELAWVKVFFLEQQTIIPVIQPEALQQFNFN